MGMDLTIWKARNHEVFKHDNWYTNGEVEEKYYARKFWDMVYNCRFIPKDYENGEFIEINKDNLEEMIRVACEYRNYWDNYDDIPKLCELRDEYDMIIESGYKLYFEYNY